MNVELIDKIKSDILQVLENRLNWVILLFSLEGNICKLRFKRTAIRYNMDRLSVKELSDGKYLFTYKEDNKDFSFIFDNYNVTSDVELKEEN